MGTNYYTTAGNECPCCHRGDEELHIGKSSAGWCFTMHVMPESWQEPRIPNWDAWKNYLQHRTITNEYGEVISLEELIRIVEERDGERKKPMEPDWLIRNHAEEGPNNLARHQIDGQHCIGHGEGTWDYIMGEFS